MVRIPTHEWELPAIHRNGPSTLGTPAILQFEHPTEHSREHWITLDGARVRYLHAGAGDPILLVHGLLGYSFSWRHSIPALARQAEVFAVDLPGAGFSQAAPGMDCHLRACAERMLHFLDALKLPASDVMATSHGGAVAMMAASIAPSRFRRLILVAPVNPWSAHGKVLAALFGSPLVAALFLAVAPHLKIIHRFVLERLFGDPRRIRPGTLEGYQAPLTQPGALAYGLGILRSWRHDLQELKQALPCIAHVPTLLVWGDRDIAVDPASAVMLQGQFENCRTIMMPGVGHVPYEEVPEEFNQIVVEFCRKRVKAEQPI